MTAGYYRDTIVACGGWAPNFGDGETFETDKCFELSKDLSQWVEIASLPDGNEKGMSSSVIDDKLFLTGGNDGLTYLDTTYILDNQLFFSGPPLPIQAADICQLTINGTHIFFTNGQETFLLDWYAQDYTILHEQNVRYPALICGYLDNPDFGPEVLVGLGTESYIFNLDDVAWREGPAMPVQIGHAAVAQLSDGFLMIGGTERLGDTVSSEKLDTIYKFSQYSYQWEQIGRLSSVRRDASAVPVPDSFLNCQ